MRIGITSQNFRTITGHAGKTRRFLVYLGDPETGSLREAERIALPKEQSLHEYKGDEPHPIQSFDVLITAGCGQGFIRRMAAWGVQLHVTAETDPLTAAQAVLRGDSLPPPVPHEH